MPSSHACLRQSAPLLTQPLAGAWLITGELFQNHPPYAPRRIARVSFCSRGKRHRRCTHQHIRPPPRL
ncbi:hypothetical protein, unknown function [Leishmania donovani]|uniref:Uncharacterized protein n=1 Tax=Leishmania donovani TaxID=5661 RepID=E9BMX5_LEIDO|nr:hypothetical protein, unknown function [Leishmania donovani]CBZ36603.1 hypothetical protein, unknown function [Leishmania donovani]